MVTRPLLRQDIQTFYGNEIYHNEMFSGHDIPEKRLVTYLT